MALVSKTLLALDGGKPLLNRTLPPWPYFAPDEIEAARSVLASGKVNYWTGEEGRQFEREYAAHIGTQYAIAVANGTVALELALYASGIGPGDEVIVPSRTFIASAGCAVMRGAVPVVAEVDPESGNITAKTIAEVLSARTKAIVAVHLAGWPCDMDSILVLARQHGLKVIEDCAQAHGATYKGRHVGSMGDVGAFSFCQDKILSTGGEGGLVTTNDSRIWELAWSFKDHGKNYEAVHTREHSSGFRWVHESFGTNWRLTEMQSAIGRVLLRKLPERIRLRRRNAAILDDAFSRIPAFRVTLPPEGYGHSYYKYYVYLRPERIRRGWDRDRTVAAINAEGAPCFTGTCSEIYLEKAFRESMRPRLRHPTARTLGATSLMFLVHHTIAVEEMEAVCCAVDKVMSHAVTVD